MGDVEERDFVARFLGEYFAECEEHLTEVRASLLLIEQNPGRGRPPQSVLDDLFRNFHSLKGISAIADIREGERLAHEMESYLRVLRDDAAVITPAGFDALVAGARVFEALLVAKRANAPMPAIGPAIEQLAAAARGRADGRSAATTTTEGTSTRRWTVTFAPSPELVARGVKVDSIRQRMLAVGAIESVTPRVLDAGRIAFEFVMTTEDEAALRSWAADGITFTPAEPTVPVDASAADVPGVPVPVDAPITTANYVRVDLARLDDLMRHVGDMVVTRSRMADVLQHAESTVPPAEWRALAEHSERLERQLRDLREGVMRVRLVPVGEIFRRMPFVVRDLARDGGKRVQMLLAGQDTEIDKFLIERMLDPVLHLVRNAVSHGIEPPDQRVAAGKPPDGTIRLSAVTVGESVVLEIADDGAGLDRAAILRRATVGADLPGNGGLDDRQLLDIICAPGFSTRDQADRASGRGVGMAVVRDTVRELGGTLEVSSEPGRGTTYRITLPLTLAIADALLVTVGAHTYAVPQSAVHEAIEVEPAAVNAIEGNELVVYRGGTLPVVRLSRLFQLQPDPGRLRLHALVVGIGAAAIGLLVDRIVGQREIVVKTMTDPLVKVDGVTGVTELGDGRVILILDAVWLARQGRGRAAARQLTAQGRRS